MLIATWILSSILAAFNLLAGGGKALTPWEHLSKKMPWTETVGKNLSYLAAWAEIIGAIGLIVPNILAHTLQGWQWATWVSVAAAIGLTIVQILAIGVHAARKEYRNLPVNIVATGLGIVTAVLIALT